jgi:hypothetical protein
MQKVRRSRRIRRFVLALAVAAVVAPAAQAHVDARGASEGAAAVRPDDRAARHSPGASSETVAVRPDDRAARFVATGSVDLVALRPDDRATRFSPTGSIELVAVRPDDRAVRPGPNFEPTIGSEYNQYAYRRALPQDYGVRTIQVVSKPDGFDWSDAGIGAGSLFGALLLAAGAALAARHLDRHKQALA